MFNFAELGCNTKIINDFINNNFFNNYKQINKDCLIAIKNDNKKIKIEDKKIEVVNIANYKKNNIEEYNIKINEDIKKMRIDIKNNNKLILDENNKIDAHSKIKDFKKICKTANKKIINKFIKK